MIAVRRLFAKNFAIAFPTRAFQFFEQLRQTFGVVRRQYAPAVRYIGVAKRFVIGELRSRAIIQRRWVTLAFAARSLQVNVLSSIAYLGD